MTATQTESKTEDLSFPGLMLFINKTGYVGLLVFLILIGFALFAPLSGGAIASGTISPEGSRRIVQHLEGGVINTIHVRDGDFVEQGSPLITLSEVQGRSDRNIALGELRILQIVEARLLAERAGTTEIEKPEDFERDDVPLNDYFDEQRELLAQSLQLWSSKQELLRERQGQIQSEIHSSLEAISSYEQQSEFLEEEIQSAYLLFEQKLFTKPRLLALEREKARIDGLSASTNAQVASLRGQVNEVEIQLIEASSQRMARISSDLADVRAQAKSVQEKLNVTEDILSRTLITAPIRGQIIDLQFKTVGGVVRPGDTIASMVPIDERLLVRAEISPTDIDIVRRGQDAKVVFSALSNSLPQFEGRVLKVSNDTQTNQVTGLSFYAAEIEVDLDQLKTSKIAEKLVSGMPADVVIETEKRTLMSYILEPLKSTFRKGMRETNVVSSELE